MREYVLYLAADHKQHPVTGNYLYSGTITPIGGGAQVHVKYAEKLPNGCFLVEETTPLFYHLDNYKVTGRYCGMLALTPHKE